MALSWTMLSPNDTSVSALINLTYSMDSAAFKALGELIAPALNYTIIDSENIAFK